MVAPVAVADGVADTEEVAVADGVCETEGDGEGGTVPVAPGGGVPEGDGAVVAVAADEGATEAVGVGVCAPTGDKVKSCSVLWQLLTATTA